jgi:hypothetical protein
MQGNFNMDLGYLEDPWPDYILGQKQILAYCSSDMCSQEGAMYKDRSLKLGIVKEVNIHTDYCPDCGSALFWTKKGLERCLTHKTIPKRRPQGMMR